jgi:hypothetical protein
MSGLLPQEVIALKTAGNVMEMCIDLDSGDATRDASPTRSFGTQGSQCAKKKWREKIGLAGPSVTTVDQTSGYAMRQRGVVPDGLRLCPQWHDPGLSGTTALFERLLVG